MVRKMVFLFIVITVHLTLAIWTDDEDLTAEKEAKRRRSNLISNRLTDHAPDEIIESSGQGPDEAWSDTKSNFTKVNICGKEYYCRDAKKGPCHRNEIFAERPSTSGSCFGRYSPSMWRNCRPSTDTEMRKKPSLTGSCELRFPQKPCHGYPSSYRYYRRTSKCYPCSSSPYWRRYGRMSSPCGRKKMFTDIDGMNGACRCRRKNHLMWLFDNQCYPVYTKGPCPKDQWLAPYTKGYSICKRCPCPKLADGHHIPWRRPGRPGCYSSFRKGPCRPGSYFMIEDYVGAKGRCIGRRQRSSYRRRSHANRNMMNGLWGGNSLSMGYPDDRSLFSDSFNWF